MLAEGYSSVRGGEAMDLLMRLMAGVAASWIVPDPVPQQSHPSGYEEHVSGARANLRIVR
jgi:hypothetical protein